jgi:hypothetical protein
LIALGQGEDVRYAFGARRVHLTLEFWHDSLATARYQLYAKAPLMKTYLGRARNRVTAEFNDEVALRLSSPDRTVRSRISKFGSLSIERSPGQTLGDVDVLVLDHALKLLVAIEAKDFEVARTPAELKNELEQTIVGPKSAVAHHGERVVWLRAHLGEVLANFGIPAQDRSEWRLEACVVVSEPLLSPLLRSSPFAFLTLDDVESTIFVARGRRALGHRRKG